jgi:hypothetical protein
MATDNGGSAPATPDERHPAYWLEWSACGLDVISSQLDVMSSLDASGGCFYGIDYSGFLHFSSKTVFLSLYLSRPRAPAKAN